MTEKKKTLKDLVGEKTTLKKESTAIERLKALSNGTKLQSSAELAEAMRAIVEKKSGVGSHSIIKPEDLIEQTEVRCKISGCEGVIVQEYFIPYIPAQFGGENLIGPASYNIATIKNKKLARIYCPVCGVMYAFVPKE